MVCGPHIGILAGLASTYSGGAFGSSYQNETSYVTDAQIGSAYESETNRYVSQYITSTESNIGYRSQEEASYLAMPVDYKLQVPSWNTISYPSVSTYVPESKTETAEPIKTVIIQSSISDKLEPKKNVDQKRDELASLIRSETQSSTEKKRDELAGLIREELTSTNILYN
jgi:hypothetical protein